MHNLISLMLFDQTRATRADFKIADLVLVIVEHTKLSKVRKRFTQGQSY